MYPFSLARVEALVAGIAESLPLEELKALYDASRPAYEQFEVLAPAFSQTDSDLDARPDGFDGGAFPLPCARPQWWGTAFC